VQFGAGKAENKVGVVGGFGVMGNHEHGHAFVGKAAEIAETTLAFS